MLDERQDYFGHTVNVASRVQDLADPGAILATKPIVESANVGRILAEAGFTTTRAIVAARRERGRDGLRDPTGVLARAPDASIGPRTRSARRNIGGLTSRVAAAPRP